MSSTAGYYGDNLYKELWQACAGPLVNLPVEGQQVYYFPQGHIEQLEPELGSYLQDENWFPQLNIPPHILCRVINVQRKVELETDEVFAQITLLPEHSEYSSPDFQQPEPVDLIHSFRKTLTASDTSRLGGLVISPEQAETFPPLDKSQDIPSQELIATDLGGNKWHFKHIFQSKRDCHLLTSGWNVFARSKKLVAGDAVIFLRGESGTLLIGVRRLKQSKTGMMFPDLTASSIRLGLLATASHSFITGTLFTVYYKPRANQSSFIVEVNKYLEAQDKKFSVGMRFAMKLEDNQVPEISFQGIITAIEDISSRWPLSDWRCLKVSWDGPSSISLPERVSPWELEPLVAITLPEYHSLKRSKQRKSFIFPAAIPDDGTWMFPAEAPFISYHEINSSSSSSAISKSDYSSSSDDSSFDSASVNQMENATESVVDECSSLNQRENLNKSCDLKQDWQIRRHAKIRMEGTLVGRSVDMTRFTSHEELLKELELMFEIEGELHESSKRWLVVCTDATGEVKMAEDHPWLEFCSMVKKIFINRIG